MGIAFLSADPTQDAERGFVESPCGCKLFVARHSGEYKQARELVRTAFMRMVETMAAGTASFEDKEAGISGDIASPGAVVEVLVRLRGVDWNVSLRGDPDTKAVVAGKRYEGEALALLIGRIVMRIAPALLDRMPAPYLPIFQPCSAEPHGSAN